MKTNELIKLGLAFAAGYYLCKNGISIQSVSTTVLPQQSVLDSKYNNSVPIASYHKASKVGGRYFRNSNISTKTSI